MKAPRGKFLGPVAPGGADSSSQVNAKASSSMAAVSPIKLKRKRSCTIERQAKLFADLDEAESLTLDLLTLASSTALSLSNAIITPLEENEEIFLKCDADGKKYMDKVKRIHVLLSPHAHLVVSYKNHDVDMGVEIVRTQISQTSSNIADNSNLERNEKYGSDRKTTKQQSLQSGPRGDGKSDSSPDFSGHPANVEKGVTSPRNMYAARVELRLALERREVLREMVRLEKAKLQAAGIK